MTKRTTMAVLTATAAAAGLIGLAAPAAQADGYGDTVISKVVVNGGKPVVVDTTHATTFSVSVTARDNSGIKGLSVLDLEGPAYGFAQPNSRPVCTAVNDTTSTCTAKFTFDPRADFYDNSPAGTWYVDAWADAKDGDFFTSEKAGSFKVQRHAKLTVNASPEPVKKGRTITVTGTLSRADWRIGYQKYVGVKDQSVKLQFRKKGSTKYVDVKNVKSGTNGALKTTVTASVDGYYRYTWAGLSTTAPATATGDFVDVR
ncbi:calcium-binding protein [Streptomyces palmae]|uniref:Calcium-binding protein n=2 Tax=Streptomyces palmae TaxID=1701085 RepID=A0A4Z0H5D4_9ACTN|nr:calcium-binding protein [Streptomyces palmae]TGB06273.1 calcium-binding protein [Streptomyces palmae]